MNNNPVRETYKLHVTAALIYTRGYKLPNARFRRRRFTSDKNTMFSSLAEITYLYSDTVAFMRRLRSLCLGSSIAHPTHLLVVDVTGYL